MFLDSTLGGYHVFQITPGERWILDTKCFWASDGEVNLRIWIHPAHRKKGYGTAALRRSRSEMAAQFPAVPLVVRAPGATVTR